MSLLLVPDVRLTGNHPAVMLMQLMLYSLKEHTHIHMYTHSHVRVKAFLLPLIAGFFHHEDKNGGEGGD